MQKLVSFFKYNNAIPIAFTIIMLSAATTYAAANPEVVIDKQLTVISIDNTYIVNKDLSSYTPTAKILSVREDSDYYYVDYSLTTIDLVDYVWKDVTTTENIRVSKTGLGAYRDLGLYVTDQIKQKIAQEILRLRETQEIERQQVSHMQVATAYSGLVGGFLSDKVETVAGYEPVVEPPKTKKEEETFARPDPNAKPPQAVPPQPIDENPAEEILPEEEEVSGENDPVTEGATTTNTRPEITLLGESSVRVPLGGSYTDLGATVIDDHDANILLELYLNDVSVESITINTAATGTHTITYFAEDSGGKTNAVTRTVVVYDPGAPAESVPSPEPNEDNKEETTETPASDTASSSAPAPTQEEPTTATPAVPSEPLPATTPEPIQNTESTTG